MKTNNKEVDELEMAIVGMINAYCLNTFGQQMPATFKSGKFVIPDIIKDSLQTLLHQELQKARQNWLREELKELESWGGIGWSTDDWANEVHALIDRYQSELDQPDLLDDNK